MVGRLALNQETRVQFLLPELRTLCAPGQSLLVVMPDSESGGPPLRGGALVRFQPPELIVWQRTEVIRPDEEPVSKTGGDLMGACGFESHGFRSIKIRVPWPSGEGSTLTR